MGQPAAKQGDHVTAIDMHVVLAPPFAQPTPLPFPFNGVLDGALSPNVRVNGRPAATVGSTATNTPPHLPVPGPFQVPPRNRGVVIAGSATVRVNGRPAARAGDRAMTCNDPVDLPVGTVVVAGAPSVLIGG